MRELLVCKKQFNDSVGFYAYNPEKLFVWNEKIEKSNLFAIVKLQNHYELVEVIGLADCLVDNIKLSGVAIELIEVDEEKINANYYDVKEEEDNGTN